MGKNARSPFSTRACAVMLCASVTGMCGGASAEEFYKGKTVSVFIGSGPAGSYDNFGRLAARHMGRFVPGSPAFVAQNMPGAGSIQVANYIYNIGSKDGTALGLMSPSTTVIQTFPGARYEAVRFRWIGRITTNSNVTFAMRTSGVRTIEDAMKNEVRLGATAPSSPLAFQTRVINHIAGTRFKLVLGYPDAAATLLAMERGEVDAVTTAWNTLKTARPDWLANGKIDILLQYGLSRHPELPNIPLAGEMGKTEADRQQLQLFMNAADVGYSLMAAPETPDDRVAILRAAFDTMTSDGEFLKDAERIESGLAPLNGAKLEQIIKDTATISPEMRDRALRALTTD